MADYNQDFITFKGDNVSPLFTVTDASGNPINISTVTQIAWSAQRNLLDSTVVLTRTLTGGGIALVGGGTNGQFQVNLQPADTTPLSGWYMHVATITDSANNVTTVAVGQMQVAPTPNWTYDDGTSASEDIYDIREMIGDTAPGDQQLSDQTLFNVRKRYSNNYMAGYDCAKRIAAKYARQVDVVQGTLKTNYSMRSKSYLKIAQLLLADGIVRGGAMPFVGGISISQKQDAVTDTDRVPPSFVIAMFDNLLPSAPVGQQVNANLNVPTDATQLNSP